MKLSLVGGVREASLRGALAKAAPGDHQVHDRNKLAWVALADVEASTLAAIHAAVGGAMIVLDVSLAGDKATASRRGLPAEGKPVDLSKAATEILASWGPVDPEAGVSDADRARDLALALAEDIQPPPPPAAVPMGKGKAMPLKRKGTGVAREKPMHAVWAEALLQKLVEDEGLELSGDPPVAKVASVLSKHDDEGKLPNDIGETLLDMLVDDPAVEEVFADGDAIVATARSTRPS